MNRSPSYWALLLGCGVLLLLCGLAESCHASRLYPYVGIAWRYDVDEALSPDAKTLVRVGVPLSLGRVAIAPTVSANTGRVEFGIEARYLLRKPD